MPAPSSPAPSAHSSSATSLSNRTCLRAKFGPNSGTMTKADVTVIDLRLLQQYFQLSTDRDQLRVPEQCSRTQAATIKNNGLRETDDLFLAKISEQLRRVVASNECEAVFRSEKSEVSDSAAFSPSMPSVYGPPLPSDFWSWCSICPSTALWPSLL